MQGEKNQNWVMTVGKIPTKYKICHLRNQLKWRNEFEFYMFTATKTFRLPFDFSAQFTL